MGASGPSAGLHRLYITEPGERPAPRFSYQLACEREVAGADCAERARISYPRFAIRGAGRAEIGSHSPHYALKVEVLGGDAHGGSPVPPIESDPPGGMPCPQSAAIRCSSWGSSALAPPRRAPRTWSEANPARPFSLPIVRAAIAAPRALPMG